MEGRPERPLIPRCRRLRFAGAATLLALAACGGADPVPEVAQDESERRGEQHLVSSSHPLASEAGRQVLQKGGSAVDAAVAVQMMLAFVEPAESGPGGGGFLLHRDGESGQMAVYDGRETAPAAARPDRFLTLGVPRPLGLSVISGKSVGVPGLVAMLERAHADHGRLPWSDLFQPAIERARAGVDYPERLARQVRSDRSLRLFGDLRRGLVAQARDEPARLENPELAGSLDRIADKGSAGFYSGPLAEEMVAAVTGRRFGAGDMTLEDLAGYRPRVRRPVCGTYRRWRVCGPPPPSSGGVSLLQILGMLEHFDLSGKEPDSPEVIHLVAEASRLAFADRFLHLGDPEAVAVPVSALLDLEYLQSRAERIDPGSARSRVRPGMPGVAPELPDAPEPVEAETTGTSHFSIIDGQGNAVAMTSSIEAPFGSRILVGGFLLNNQLTDFSFRPRVDGYDLANAAGPGKRPRSSMAPTLVFDPDGELELVIGSRGGSRIIGHVARVLVAVLDGGRSLQEAVAMPNFVHRGEGLELERGSDLKRHRSELVGMGHRVRMRTMTSGLNGIQRVDGGWEGSIDPRLDARVRAD